MNLLKLVAASSFIICALAACGGGGSAPAGPSTVVSGVATKGPFLKNSAVKVFAVTNGAKGALITQTLTSDDNGSYNANLGSYTGPVIVEVSGSYHDEATGHDVTVADTAPIRAALPLAQGTVTLPVTPLTELALQKAASLTPDGISAANTLVSGIFKLDIIATMPVAPSAAALAGASQAQKDYTLALAAVSQMASASAGSSDADKLKSALDSLSQGISSTGMSSGSSADFQGALTTFVTTNANNMTGVTDTSSTSLVNAGTLSKSYTLTLQGNTGAASGVQFDLVLPSGVSVNFNTMEAAVLDSSLALPATAPSDLLVAAKYAAGTVTVGMLSLKGMAAGTLATLTCNLAPGVTAPAGSAFVVNNLKVMDINSGPMTGVSVTVN